MQGQIMMRPSDETNDFVCGYVCAPTGRFSPEHLYRAACMNPGDPMVLDTEVTPPCGQEEGPAYYPSDFAFADLGNMTTQNIWSLYETAGPSMQLYVRGSTAPAPDGFEIIMFAGIMRQHTDAPLFEAEVLHNFNICPFTSQFSFAPVEDPARRDLQGCRGSSNATILRMPIWGWDAECWGFNSTLTPEVCICTDYLRELTVRDIIEGPDALTAAEKADKDKFNAIHDYAVLGGARSSFVRDDRFQAYVRELVKIDGYDAVRSFVGVSTADRGRRSNAQAVKILTDSLIGA